LGTPVEDKEDLIERLRRHQGDLRRLGVRRSLSGSFQRDFLNRSMVTA